MISIALKLLCRLSIQQTLMGKSFNSPLQIYEFHTARLMKSQGAKISLETAIFRYFFGILLWMYSFPKTSRNP